MAEHHSILIIGGGAAGITVAARLRRRGRTGIAIVEPSEVHYYHPLWTLVGGGCASADETRRFESTVIPDGVEWIKGSAAGVDPANRTVTLADGRNLAYDHLVVAAGIQLDFDKIPGMQAAMDSPYVSSNYTFETAPKTWELIRGMRSGTAVFTMPANPIKCAGAPQKICYLAADYWRKQGVLDDIRVVLSLPTPGMFGVKVFADALAQVAEGYGIEVHLSSEATEIDPDSKKVYLTENDGRTEIDYDMMHVVPRQSAPDWIKASPLADPDNPMGYVQVDKHTLQHIRFPEIFALGDAGSTPNSKTGAAVRHQAPVLVDNLLAAIDGRPLTASYDGYASCPLTTSRDKMLLAEFDYTMQPRPTFTFIDTTKPRKDMWYLKRYGLPMMYWNMMLKGRA